MSDTVLALELDVGQFSHPGRKRSNNEDWLGTFQPDDATRLDTKGRLFLVADGMGGHQSGDLASRSAVDQVIRNYVQDPSSDVAFSLRRAIQSANANLYARTEGRKGRSHWGTTLVGAVVRHDKLWIANVGDSRAYLLRGGSVRQLSQDHSFLPGEKVGRHLITRALGSKDSVEVDLFPPIKLWAGDRVLLCSDGLTTPLSDEEIRHIAGRYPAQAGAEALVRAANERGGPDNVSVILIQVAGRHSPGGLLAALGMSRTWQMISEHLERALVGGEWEILRSPLFVVVILMLVLLVLLGLGFLLGLVIF
ncbi:MAG: protein phosphatase 2C domain-containing protein [Anaerolineae bacterium]|jgi:protein phosphatase